jgi:hypothetical protein
VVATRGSRWRETINEAQRHTAAERSEMTRATRPGPRRPASGAVCAQHDDNHNDDKRSAVMGVESRAGCDRAHKCTNHTTVHADSADRRPPSTARSVRPS